MTARRVVTLQLIRWDSPHKVDQPIFSVHDSFHDAVTFGGRYVRGLEQEVDPQIYELLVGFDTPLARWERNMPGLNIGGKLLLPRTRLGRAAYKQALFQLNTPLAQRALLAPKAA